ncbi:MAG: serine/threonine-protein kinase, partial [Planctomycetota bacterium]|nr:serine/threonine-protein kinase [Planctomycetota bacterium]
MSPRTSKLSSEISNTGTNVSFESSTTYTILEEIGRGGMGVVYLAERTCMGVGDLVVLKTIRSLSTEHEDRLRKEANIATRLRHQNIVKTYGLAVLPYSSLPEQFRKDLEASRSGCSDGELSVGKRRDLKRRKRRKLQDRAQNRLQGRSQNRQRIRAASISPRKDSDEGRLVLIAMNYVEGLSLHQIMVDHLRAGYLIPPMLSAFILSRICRALAYAHNFIVHRDISPENILIDRHGVCQLTDFGIAVGAGESRQGVAGKVTYMPPEGLRSELVDERGDTYSLGIVFYYLLTGILPYFTERGRPVREQMKKIRRQIDRGTPTPRGVREDVPEILSEITMRMIDPSPARRYPRISTIGEELERDHLYASGYGPTNTSL